MHESNVVNTIAKINPNKNPKVNIITSLSWFTKLKYAIHSSPTFFEVNTGTETVTEQLNNGSYILVSNQLGSVYQMMGMAFITITDYANGRTYTPIVGGDWFNQLEVKFEGKNLLITNSSEARTYCTIFKL